MKRIYFETGAAGQGGASPVQQPVAGAVPAVNLEQPQGTEQFNPNAGTPVPVAQAEIARPTQAAFNMRDMLDISTFKAMNGIDKINVVKGRDAGKRLFADTAAGRLFFGLKTNLAKPLYIARGQYNAYWVFNQEVTQVAEL